MSLLHNVPEGTQSAVAGRRPPGPPPPQGAAEGHADRTPPAGGVSGGGGSLTRVTANFTPRAISALEKIAGETGDSKTDILNRSVLLYDAILDVVERDGGVLYASYPDGTQERLRFIG